MNQTMKENTKHRVRLSKVLLNLILSAAIIFGSMPCKPFVMEVKADTPAPAEKTITDLGLGTGEIKKHKSPSDSSVSWNGDYVYFGKYGGEAMKYRALSILDYRTNGNNYLLLDCDNVLTNDKFDGDSNIWAKTIDGDFKESDIHNWLVGDQFYKNKGVFSNAEKYAIVGDNTSYEGDWKVGYPDGTYENNDLTAEDPVFLLDARSVINDNLGYYISTAASASRIKKDLSGDPAKWWLRSKSTETKDGKPCVFSVETDGSLSKNSVNDANVGVSPALTVNLARVLFSSKVGSNGTGSVYKLTIRDNSLGDPEYGYCTRDGNRVTIPYTIKDGEPTQLSVVVTKNYEWNSSSGWIKKNEDKYAALLQYAKLDTGDSFDDVGIGTFNLDPGIEGEWGKDYNVYILAEQVNGAKETDYASTPVEIKQLEVSVLRNEYTYDGYENGLILSAIDADYLEEEYLYGETPDSCSLNSLGITNVSDSPKTIYYIVNAKNHLSVKGSADVIINKAPLKVKASDRSITYGSPLPKDFEPVYYGFVDNEDSSVLKWTEGPKFESDYVSGNDVGRYPVRIKGELTADNYEVNLADGVLEVVRATHPDVNVSGNAAYGTEGILELNEEIEAEGTLGSVSVSADEYQILDGAPVTDGTKLRFKFKNNPENVGKKAKVTVSVNGAKNYQDYTINAELEVIEVISCDHKNTERRDMKEATCVSKGHTGKLYCLDCGTILDEGEEIPIDPENHQFDEGKVTTQPTIFKEGVKTFTCIRGCGHSYTVAIPRLEGEEDLSDLVEDTADLSGNAAPKIEEKKDENGNTIEETVTIGGEEVSKTVTDPATGKETVETKVWIGGLQSSYTYTGSSIKPSINVYDGTRKLTAGQDYSVSYKNNKDAGKATVTVKFKGDYKGAKSVTEDFTITPAVLGQDIIAHETGVAVKKKAQKPVPVLTWKETGEKVNSKYFSITYEPGTVREAGTYTATIKPKNAGGNFAGSTTALIKVADKSKLLSNAKVSFDKKSYPYIGTAITPKYTLTLDGAALTEGRDYRRVSIADNTYPGKATVIFEAVSTNSAGYVGSKTATFKISGKKELKEGAAFSFDVAESVTYAKGGAKPEVTVTDKERGVILKEGQDYTLSYAKNKAVTNGSKTGEVRIKGKGNYKGKVTLYFAVTQQSLKAEGIAISAADQFTTRQKLKKPSVTIIDIDGKKLKEGKDYTVGQTDASDSKNTEKQGVVSFTVKGKGNYKDETIAATFRYEEKSSNIGKSKAVKKIADQAYTGKAVQLSNTELEGVLSLSGKTLVPGTDFKIISTGYSNNVKKGTAKVTVQGINTYAGTKTLTFKIVQGKVNYQGALVGGTWQ